MTIHDSKTNTGFPDSIEDEETFTDFIYSEIHSRISQLYLRGKLRPEQISQRLWDLVDAVKHITT